ncbi:MAG TPA: hypothetical protein VFM10_04375, partial [Terriglobales bacterium]|nr:hypothetical protein [Terriglobales bacterium]
MWVFSSVIHHEISPQLASTATYSPAPAEGKVRVYNLLFGPRFSATTGKVTPFAEALFGLAHTRVSACAAGISADQSSNNFGMAFGSGLDV